MRGYRPYLVIPVFAALTVAWPQAQTPAPDAAAKVLAAAREAMGGEKRFAAVKTVVVTGQTRQVRGDNLVPIEFEISIELPDKYTRRDEIPAQESGPTTIGFNGDALIQLPVPVAPTPPPGAPAPNPAQAEAAQRARVNTAKQDFVRLTLGLFMTSFSTYPLTFTIVGQAEAPQGKADVLDVKGPANFAARLFVNSATHLPIMLSWQGAPPGRGRGPAPAAGPAGAAPATPPAPIENRLYYADYRESDGLQLPFRLRRAVGADTNEETTFDRFRINARIDPKKFEPLK